MMNFFDALMNYLLKFIFKEYINAAQINFHLKQETFIMRQNRCHTTS